MEALPRLPMTSFELKIPTDKVSFGPKLKPYITSFYNEDGETYSEEIHKLDMLRGSATRPSIELTGCQVLKRYYCQLMFLKSRFPMEEGQPCATFFSWKDIHTNMTCTFPDINYELSCILYNIGALHSQLGAVDTRTTSESMKLACTHFQCAAWAFETLREHHSQFTILLGPNEILTYMQHVCYAQAQECILEKGMLDSRKPTIITKIAVQVVEYYKQALNVLQAGGEEGSFSDILGSKVYKKWFQYITFKISYNRCIVLLYHGLQSEEQQKMGERVAFYKAALDQLEEARKLASHMPNKQQLEEALVFTLDVVEGKRKAAKNENEFIYHEEVPERENLQEVKGASLVKGIPFKVNDIEVSGEDIFARLVPMEAHEASSLYSEQKAQMLRKYGQIIDVKDQALAEFMSSLQLDCLSDMQKASGLTQDLIDRAAAISAKPNATQELVSAMGKLSNTYHEVEAMLNEINALLQEEEKNEQEYQALMGKRPPSIVATDLSREAAKYQEAHNKACESNQNLHKAMLTHVANLKILALPLSQLKTQIPSIELPNANVDDTALKEIMNLNSKVEEMKNQRKMLWGQLRDAVHNDDITGKLATKTADLPMDQLFEAELKKHEKLTNLIEQNCSAQENICKALVDSYARFSSSRKYIQDIINKRSMTITALMNSYDTYDDLLLKASKGLEFYSKLETNVTKLLGRVRSSCKVQQEERDQILLKNGQGKTEPTNITGNVSSSVTPPVTTTTTGGGGTAVVTTPKPKLKDYLDSMKGVEKVPHVDVLQYSNYPSNMPIATDNSAWPPSVRPPPLGSEVTADLPGQKVENKFGVQGQYVPNYAQQYGQTGGYIQSTDGGKDPLAERMASLRIGSNMPETQMYTQYGSYGTTQSSYPVTTTYTDSSTVSSTQYPYVTTSEQYSSYNTGTYPRQQVTGYVQQNLGQYAYGTQMPYQKGVDGTQDGQYQMPTSNQPAPGQYQIPVTSQSGQQYQMPITSQAAYASNQYQMPATTQTGYQMQYQTPTTGQSNVQYQMPTIPVTGQSSLQYPATTQGNMQYVPTSDQSQYSQQQQQYYMQNQQYMYQNPQLQSAQFPTQQYSDPSQQYLSSQPQYPSPQPATTQTYSQNPTNQQPYSVHAQSYTQPYTSVYNQTNTYPSSQSQPVPQTQSSDVYSQYGYQQYYGNVSSVQSQVPYGSVVTTAFTSGTYTTYTTTNTLPSSSITTSTTQPTPGLAGNSTAYAINKDGQSTGQSIGAYGNSLVSSSYGTSNEQASNLYTTPGQIQGNEVYNVYGPQSTTVIYSNQYAQTYPTSQGAAANVQYPSQTAQTYDANYYNYYANYQSAQVSTPQQQSYLPTNSSSAVSKATETEQKKETNIDLLSGLDFTINQAPLIPQQTPAVKEQPKPEPEKPAAVTVPPAKPPQDVSKVESREVVKIEKAKTEKVPVRDPFEDPNMIFQLGIEVEKLEKTVDALLNKSLNGPTMLDTKWKEVQEADLHKKSISVARCYPMKNRFPDILPYDFTRVELKTTKDDYINASHVKDVTRYAPPLILTQAPLTQTLDDFWTLAWEQNVELIVCLLSNSELGVEIYWPQEIGRDLIIGQKVLSLQSETVKPYWTERVIVINIPEQKLTKTLLHMQFTSWPGSLFPKPEPVVEFVKEITEKYKQQRDVSRPILMHCTSGIGKSGLFALLTVLISETKAIGCPLPDLSQTAMKIACTRKNVMRDREHLKFSYTTFLHFAKTLHRTLAKLESTEEPEKKKVPAEKEVQVNDPFSDIDPLWATKRPS